MSLPLFLIQVFIISLSGVMAPGPVTTAAIAMGARSRYAGLLLALGHAIIEFPLMILLILGIAKFLESARTQIVIGLAGGIFLVVMAIQISTSLKTVGNEQQSPRKDKPILTGLVLSVSNPYFLIWWAVIGLSFVIQAAELGIWAFIFFALVHWLCDGLWLLILSWSSFKGARIFGPIGQKTLLIVCAVVLFLFGLKFLYDASSNLLK